MSPRGPGPTARPEGRREGWVFPFPGLSLARTPPVDRPTFWTRALGDPPEVYGERLRFRDDDVWRGVDPTRSKLGAALCRGLRELPIAPGASVLYLGGASGTTASHVADLVGRRGAVYAVEKSPRPFQRLLDVARRWPNLYPVLADVRDPRSYLPWVPPVDALYLDVAQPEQPEIALEHARLFLRRGGGLLFALKVPSLRRRDGGPDPVEATRRTLSRVFDLAPPLGLEPFHRGHVMLTGLYRAGP